jgi:sugar phosphate isomerase/epimerase
MKFAVFTVSTPAYTPEEVVVKLKEFGYDGVEWRVIDEPPNPPGMGFWHGNRATIPFTGLVDAAPAFQKLADEQGLEIPSIGTYVRADDLDNVETAMKGAVAMGARRLRVNVARYDGVEAFKPIWDKDREAYKRVGELAAKYDVQALIELHHRSICPSASAARLYVDGLDPEHVGVIHDLGNMVYEGFETYRLGLEMLGPYLAHVHVKNARWFPVRYLEDKSVEWKCDAAPVHKGIADVRLLFRSLKEVGYDGWITLEDFSTERPLDDRLKENLAFLKRVVAEADAAPAAGAQATQA